VVIDNLDLVGVAGPPNETHPILSVDPDAVDFDVATPKAIDVAMGELSRLLETPFLDAACSYLLLTSAA
jgi:hypothetical protein